LLRCYRIPEAYSEAVYRQTTDDFLRCLENAFRHFGGVPRRVVLDNLKAAVKQADWFDPELNPLDQFDWSFNASFPKKQVFDLATCRFLRDKRDVLWLGPPGVGKSFLVQAIGYQAIKAGYAVLYRSVFDVVRDFLHDEALSAEDKVLTRYLRPDLLIIDDMGMKQLPKRSGEYLFEIIMRRYETRSTMMTSNRPLEDWGKLLGDVPTATAILDRFLHHAELVQLNGRSYRLRHQGGVAGEVSEDAKPAKAPPGSGAAREGVR
jgi:DNA replication protein DnaC